MAKFWRMKVSVMGPPIGNERGLLPNPTRRKQICFDGIADESVVLSKR
jgi:hypothetical protein